jgi:hypothetical protein
VRVGLARDPALAGVLDGGGETVGGLDVGGVGEFDVGGAVPDTLDLELREGDEVGCDGGGSE